MMFRQCVDETGMAFERFEPDEFPSLSIMLVDATTSLNRTLCVDAAAGYSTAASVWFMLA